MCKLRNNTSSTMKSYGNIVSQKENDNSLEIKLKVIDNCAIADREFKIAVMKKLMTCTETQEGSSVSSELKIREEIFYQGDWKSEKETNSGADELNK